CQFRTRTILSCDSGLLASPCWWCDSASDRLLLHDPFRNYFGTAGFEANHGVVKVAVAAELSVRFAENLEVHRYFAAAQSVHPGANYESFAHAQGSFEFQMRCFDVPAVARLDELLHGHLVAALHLVVA